MRACVCLWDARSQLCGAREGGQWRGEAGRSVVGRERSTTSRLLDVGTARESAAGGGGGGGGSS